MTIEIIRVPDIGGSDDVEVIEVCVKVGDSITLEQSLVVLESEKASMEVPSPFAGTVTAIKISEGQEIAEGDVILELETTSSESLDNETEKESPAEEQADSVNIGTTESNDTELSRGSEDVPESEESATAVTSSSQNPSTDNEKAHAQNAEQTHIETIAIPDIGDVESADIIEVCVEVGDSVAEGESLIVLETDKASMEVPSPVAGKVISIAAKEGDVSSAGVEILQIETTAHEERELEQAPAPVQPEQKAAIAPDSTAQVDENRGDKKVSTISEVPAAQDKERSEIYAGPAVRKLAREMGVEISTVSATGPRGRVTKDDLKAYVKDALNKTKVAATTAAIPTVPEVDFSSFGEVSVEPLSKVDKLTVKNMQRSWLNVPHVTQFDDANIDDLETFRQSLKPEAESRGVKLTPMPFILKACAFALLANKKLNASLHADGENLVYKHYINIGMAVDTPVGLVVPVIKDADKKSIWELAEEIAVLSQKAKDRKLSLKEMQGASFTISSLGNIGGKGFTPIVNTPEVAILGVSKLAIKPEWDGSEFKPVKMLPLSLSYDHRVVNGADAGRFFTDLISVLDDIRRLIL